MRDSNLVSSVLLGLTLAGVDPSLVNGASLPLAITEVHSAQSTNGTVALKADWWELTNFGTEPVDLAGFRFNDATGGLTASAVTLESLVLAPGESVVFLEQSAATSLPSTDDYRRWWGAGLPAGLRVLTYATNSIGLGSGGDSLALWAPDAGGESDFVARVDFGAATVGTSFTYDPVTGIFGTPSPTSGPGILVAEEGADVASPGRTSGAIPLLIAGEPSDQVVNPGDVATFEVVANGMPRPRFRWQFAGTDLPGATSASLRVTNASAAVAGGYLAILDNGMQRATSRVATLSIRQQPVAPVFTITLSNLIVLKGGTATFVAVASGVPQPEYAWTFRGVPIPGVTTATLVVTNVGDAEAGEYEVSARNASGTVSSRATLTVRGKPNLRITEVHSASTETTDPDFARRLGLNLARTECDCATPEPDRIQALSFAQQDWWEVTSFESVPVRLLGWRLDDNSGLIANAYTITNDVVIQPGESVLFMERLTPDQFRAWWGTNELPVGLQMITYTGSGLGLSSGGDGLRLWDATTTTDADTVMSVDFPAGDPGVSFNFDPDTLEFGKPSVLGVNGVYQAPGSIDAELNQTFKNLGSPGRIRAGEVRPPAPTLVLERAADGSLRLAFPTLAGRTYELQTRGEAAAGAWTVSGPPLTPVAAGTGEFKLVVEASGHRFFRVAVR